jgi:hypothetical protein
VACVDPTSNGTPTNTGALLTDTAETTFNLGGCIALTDKTSGTACGQAYTPLQECDDAACASCFTTSTNETLLGQCESSASSGACASYVSAYESQCASEFVDGGAGNSCQDAATIVNLFCGTGG